MIAALTMMAQTKKVKNDIENSKKNLEKIKRSKCLTSYIIKKECKKSKKREKNDSKNSKKNLEKIKRSKCLTSYLIKKECKKDAFKKREKSDTKNSKKNLEKIKRSKCLTPRCEIRVANDRQNRPNLNVSF